MNHDHVEPTDEATPLVAAKVVVGLPVYNERRHIEETLRSLAAQDHNDFKVLISDNASIDGSGALCESFANHDSRFVYFRQPRNIGAVGNFAFCLDATSSEHFMWCGAHDTPSGQFLSRMSTLLDNDQAAAIAFGRRVAIDEKSEPIARMRDDDGYIYRFLDSPFLRYLQAACGLSDCVVVNGLIRRRYLAGFRIDPVKSIDKVIISHLLYFGQLRYDFSAEYRRRYFDARMTTQEERMLGGRPVVPMINKDLVDRFMADFSSIGGNAGVPSGHGWRKFLLGTSLSARFLWPTGKYVYALARLSLQGKGARPRDPLWPAEGA